jgi:hypothetical protein
VSDPEKCRAVKNGRISLHCTLAKGHDGWHEADYADHQEINYDGARHTVHTTEHVEWEPDDPVGEAAKLIAEAARRRQR